MIKVVRFGPQVADFKDNHTPAAQLCASSHFFPILEGILWLSGNETVQREQDKNLLRTTDEYSEDDQMAAFGTAELPLHLGGHCESSAASIHQSSFKRRITREAGQAMRILAHAIEHLSEESVQEDNLATAHRGEIKAVKLLMALNSQIYAECPAIPPMRNRVGAFLQRLGM